MNVNFVFMYFNLDTKASVLGDEAVIAQQIIHLFE